MNRKSRLSQSDWLRAGLDALSAAGPEALKAEPLARALETTKGSFYWHFPDVPAFRRALLDFWGSEAGAAPGDPADRTEAVAQLHALMTDGFASAPETEAAMRAWSQTDETARATMEDIDRRRLMHLEALLKEIGITNPEIARLLYAARIGMTQMGEGANGQNAGALSTMVDLVLALR